MDYTFNHQFKYNEVKTRKVLFFFKELSNNLDEHFFSYLDAIKI
ncbi:MAG: hypothetical protein ACJA08_003184 [Cyclobacteriaceae bacterium]|jgi:hypothetical protein